MPEALFGYKRLLFLVSFVVSVLCAIDDDTTPSGCPTLTTDYSDEGYHNISWKRHNNSCYLLMTEKHNFTEANESCSNEGAHMLSITDAAENKFITSLRRSSEDPAWIGLYRQTETSCDKLVSCDWVRLDGSDLGYHNWSVVSPSYSRCANIEPSGEWGNNRRCEDNLTFICEVEVLYPTTTSEATTTMMTTDIADPSSTKSTIHEAPTEEPNKKDDDDDDDKSIIIGCVVGGLVLVAIVTLVVVVLLKRHRTSRPIDQPVEVTDEETPKVDKPVRHNPAYEDMETNVTFKPSPGNTDTGASGNTDTGAHGVVDNPHNIYSKAIKKEDRPGSEGILVKENTLYGYGK